jgi:hypothetical protein
MKILTFLRRFWTKHYKKTITTSIAEQDYKVVVRHTNRTGAGRSSSKLVKSDGPVSSASTAVKATVGSGEGASHPVKRHLNGRYARITAIQGVEAMDTRSNI